MSQGQFSSGRIQKRIPECENDEDYFCMNSFTSSEKSKNKRHLKISEKQKFYSSNNNGQVSPFNQIFSPMP